MEKIISYPISFFSMMLFLLTLVIFHPIQWLCFNVFGYQAHKKSVDYLNFILLRIGHFLGNTYKVTGRELIPENVPIIFVANHQSLYDIAGIIWFMRRFHPKFVSKTVMIAVFRSAPPSARERVIIAILILSLFIILKI